MIAEFRPAIKLYERQGILVIMARGNRCEPRTWRWRAPFIGIITDVESQPKPRMMTAPKVPYVTRRLALIGMASSALCVHRTGMVRAEEARHAIAMHGEP